MGGTVRCLLKHLRAYYDGATTGRSLLFSSRWRRRRHHHHHHHPHHHRYRHLNNSACRLTPSSSLSSSSSSTSAAGKGGFLVNWYLGMLELRPVLTKSLTAASIFTAADLSSQAIVLKSSDSFDFIRTVRMAGYGMLISGPTLHLWFNFLSKILPKTDITSTLKKMVLGQTVYGPIITTVFFTQNAAFQGESASEILERLKRDLVPTFINGVVYWPMCDFITFKFIPVRLQPLVSNSFSFVWTIYLTYMASLEKVDKPKILAD